MSSSVNFYCSSADIFPEGGVKMSKLKQIILAIVVSVLFSLAWDDLSRRYQEEEARQQYFPVTPVSKVHADGPMVRI